MENDLDDRKADGRRGSDEDHSDDHSDSDEDHAEDYSTEKRLRVGQFNARGLQGSSDKRLLILREHQAWAATHAPHDFLDIIMIQDVPQRLAFKTWKTHQACYDSTAPLEEGDHPQFLSGNRYQQHKSRPNQGARKKLKKRKRLSPRDRDFKADLEEKRKRPVRRLPAVGFLVSTSIDPSCYWVKAHPGPNKDLAATLTMVTAMGTLEIHNVYNPEGSNADGRPKFVDIHSLRDTVCPKFKDKARLSMLVGDFNLHHQTWEKRCRGAPTTRATHFEKAMRASKMRLITTPGAITWSRSAKKHRGRHIGPTSTIDLMFASHALAQHVPQEEWRVIRVKAFNSDHRLIAATILTRPDKLVPPRFCWKLDDETSRRLQELVKRELTTLSTEKALIDETSTEEFAVRCSDAITKAASQCVPALDPVTNRPCLQKTSPKGEKGHATAKFIPSSRKDRARRFNRKLAKLDSTGLYQVSRSSPLWRKPRPLPHMPRLVKDSNVAGGSPELVPRGPEEGSHFLRTIHGPKTGDLRNASPPRMPDESLLGNSDESERVLKEKEVSKVLRRLKRRKAVGVGIIANEALITCVDVIEKHLEHLFEACLRLSYHPQIFKSSRTIALPKPDKEDYSFPKNWRPITLLGALSKVLDKLVANRLTKFAIETKCLPANQFGISGKSTTSALQCILNHVYTAWSLDQKATVMGLDITGAYPRVNRDRLLEAMARKNVPAWIIRFVFSWLYGSHTHLHLPGRRPERFFINLGIPQGSSLSPILFLFFASGLLEIDTTIPKPGVRAFLVSYVDDTYIIVCSDSWEMNCEALVTLHDRVQVWARANDVEFAPHKYGLLHFQREPGETRCTELPDIQGLTAKHLEPPDGYKVPHLRILGVMVDTQLKWGPHIDHIEDRVRIQQYNFWHISRTQTGPTLHQMRQLYRAKVLPIFAYACGAWYIPGGIGDPYRMSAGNMERLDKLHQAVLLDVSGGMRRTSAEVILKELHIHRMSIFLDKTATAQRAQELDTPQQRARWLDRERAWGLKFSLGRKRHPYHRLDKVARQLRNEALGTTPAKGPRTDKNRIKELANQRAEARSRAAWEAHKDAFINERKRRIPPAFSDPKGWGPHNLQRYANLPRRQSSMLFQCRAERAAVNATLYRMRVHRDNEDRSKDTPSCPCGYPNQTIEHLFSYCPDLEEVRAEELVLKLGTSNVNELLDKYPAEASAFATRHFGICKNTDVPLFLPQRGGAENATQEDKNKNKNRNRKRKAEEGGSPPVPAKKQRVEGGPGADDGKKQQPGRQSAAKGTEKGGKCGKSRRERKKDLNHKVWKKHRRDAAEG